MENDKKEIEKLDGILESRKIYGDYRDVATCSQTLKDVCDEMRRKCSGRPIGPCERESIHNICQKLARVVCGNAYVQDHWDDIANYARLASRGQQCQDREN